MINLSSGPATETTFLFDPYSETWSPGPDLPQGRVTFCSLAINEDKSRILVAGGQTTLTNGATAIINTAWIYDFDTMAHAQIASMNEPRYRMGCATANLSGKDVVVVAGGQTDNANLLQSIDVFDIATSTW